VVHEPVRGRGRDGLRPVLRELLCLFALDFLRKTTGARELGRDTNRGRKNQPRRGRGSFGNWRLTIATPSARHVASDWFS
jgi:hypothetical protein